jgi:hypothetical protein
VGLECPDLARDTVPPSIPVPLPELELVVTPAQAPAEQAPFIVERRRLFDLPPFPPYLDFLACPSSLSPGLLSIRLHTPLGP